MKYLTVTALLTSAVHAQTINKITGNAWRSPYDGQNVTALAGVVTAKGPAGFWLQSQKPDKDLSTSEGIYVYVGNKTTSWVYGNITVGDSITIDGKVSDYRANEAHVYLTEIVSPKALTVVSKGNTIPPLALGKERSPPTELYTALDNGDIFGVPGNSSQLSVVNPKLNPKTYGMDFWKSITGMYVSATDCVANGKLSRYSEIWIYCNWKTTGKNEQGGLTLTPGKGGKTDANPETIFVGTALDGTKNPDIKIGDKFADFKGVIHQQFGAQYILPESALKVVTPQTNVAGPTTLKSDGACQITVGDYNIENFSAKDKAHVNAIAEHIAKFMLSPDIMFVQEVQDNNGVSNDNTVESNLTLDALTAAIVANGGAQYNYTYIAPVKNQDGGVPGGNIRQAYLFNPNVVVLDSTIPVGTATNATQVLDNSGSSSSQSGSKKYRGPTLSLNPGRIAPDDEAWKDSRKPLVAQWNLVNGPAGSKPIFTVNVHFTSKGGSSGLTGDFRPPVNGGVDQRISQTTLVAHFVNDITDADPDALVIVAGDFNEFAESAPMKVFKKQSKLRDIEDFVGTPKTERYTYTFGQDMQELDHMLLSPKLGKGAEFEHVHVNTWTTYKLQVSDHDPSVARLKVCKAKKQA